MALQSSQGLGTWPPRIAVRHAVDIRAHHAPLDTPQMRGVNARVILTVEAQDIGDLDDGPVRMKAGAGHDPASQRLLTLAASLPATPDDRAGSASPFIVWVATCV